MLEKCKKAEVQPPSWSPWRPLVNQGLPRVEKLKGGKCAAGAFPSHLNRGGLIPQQSCTDSKGKAALYVTHPAHASPCDSPVKNPVMSLCVAMEKK